jgi:hypothetical protein
VRRVLLVDHLDLAVLKDRFKADPPMATVKVVRDDSLTWILSQACGWAI